MIRFGKILLAIILAYTYFTKKIFFKENKKIKKIEKLKKDGKKNLKFTTNNKTHQKLSIYKRVSWILFLVVYIKNKYH